MMENHDIDPREPFISENIEDYFRDTIELDDLEEYNKNEANDSMNESD